MLIITDHEDLKMCASFSLHEPWSFLIFCLELLLSSLFPATPKHNTTVMSLHFFFAVSFFKIVKHFFFCFVDLSVREECDEDPSQSDETEAEMSPPKSPSTPKNVKSKNSGTVWFCLSVIVLGPVLPSLSCSISETGLARLVIYFCFPTHQL